MVAARRVLGIAVAGIALGLCACVFGQNLIWDLQAVDENGVATHEKVAVPYVRYVPPTPENVLIVEGISLTGTGEADNTNGGGFEYYTHHIQSLEDKGGIQVYSGPWMKSMFWSSYPEIQAGDRVRVTGWAAFYTGSGKSFINDRHDETGSTMWSIEVLSHGAMPEPEVIPPIAESTSFDQTREVGGERWQTRWVKLKGVEFTSGNWATGENLFISDDTGEMYLSLAIGGNFDDFTAPVGKFDVVGIFDQEYEGMGDDPEDTWTENYRILVKTFADITPQLTITPGSGGVELKWEAKAGMTYRLLESTDMSGWSQVGSDIAGDDTVKTVVDSPGGTQHFYRLEHEVSLN